VEKSVTLAREASRRKAAKGIRRGCWLEVGKGVCEVEEKGGAVATEWYERHRGEVTSRSGGG